MENMNVLRAFFSLAYYELGEFHLLRENEASRDENLRASFLFSTRTGTHLCLHVCKLA